MMTIIRKRYLGVITLLSMAYLIHYIKVKDFWTTKHSTKMLNNWRRDAFSTVSPKAETNISKRFSQRRSYLENKCLFPYLTRKYVKFVTGYNSSKLTLCTVPKAACTIWLRLFTFLSNKPSSNRTITSLSKYEVHLTPKQNYKTYDYGKDKKLIMESTRAITTRNPYTRLWSAYIDKFLLPDFWKDIGVQVIKITRSNATDEAKRCGNDVTFSEFIQYVLKAGHITDDKGFDYHWLPVTDICDPCVFHPDYIVKQETFLPDFSYVVNQVGLLDEVRPILETDQVEYEIENEIDFNFRMYRSFSDCVTKLQLAKIIWKAMKLNGYLQPNDEFPADLTEAKINKSTILGLVQATRKCHGSNKQTKKAIRKQALIDAYRQLSQNQLTALQQFYQVDFEMFDYDNSPPV